MASLDVLPIAIIKRAYFAESREVYKEAKAHRPSGDMTKLNTHPLEKILENRIAIIDGAMGTTIRTYGMTEADIRGERFKDSTKDLLNNGDLFSLTQPEMIWRHSSPVSRGRRGHHRDQHLRRDQHHPERILRGRSARTRRPEGSRVLPEGHRRSVPRRPGLGDQRTIGAAVPRMGRSRRERDLAPAFCRRGDRAADRVSLELARCRRSGLPGRHVRSGESRLHPAGARSDRRRRRTCSWSRQSSTR